MQTIEKYITIQNPEVEADMATTDESPIAHKEEQEKRDPNPEFLIQEQTSMCTNHKETPIIQEVSPDPLMVSQQGEDVILTVKEKTDIPRGPIDMKDTIGLNTMRADFKGQKVYTC